MQFSKRMDRFGDEIFASLNDRKIEMEQQGRSFYNLSVGTPDFPVAEHIRAALIESAKDPENWKYTLRDTPRLLSAVCSYYEKRYGVRITPDQVVSCSGSEEGIGLIGLALCDEGDTVILPTPCYPVFISCTSMAGAQPFYYPMREKNGFLPDVSDIPENAARRAKFMIVSLPSNPTGSVGNEANYREIIAFAKEYDILIIHDNAYSDIIFEGGPGRSFLSYPGAMDVGVEFFSLSKSFNMTGARVSFCIGRRDVVQVFKKLRSQISFGMFMPVQEAAIAALNGPTDGLIPQCEGYRERRDALCAGLREIGWEVRDSKGSMFVWAPLPAGYTSSMDFCRKLMEEAGVICTPGVSFGPMGEGYVRFALTLPADQIREAVRAIDESGLLKHG